MRELGRQIETKRNGKTRNKKKITNSKQGKGNKKKFKRKTKKGRRK